MSFFFWLLPFGHSPAVAQSLKVTVGYSAISGKQLPAWIAKEAGIFQKNGLDVQLIYFTGGTTAILALVSGEGLKKVLNILADVAKLGLAFQYTGIATTRRFIKEQSEIVRRYVRSQVEAVHRIRTDKETSLTALNKYFGGIRSGQAAE